MEHQEKVQLINEMLEHIMVSSHEMPDCVFHYFVDNKIPMNQKPFYNLIAESFLTLFAYCKLIRENAWSQAFALLRIGIEQVAAVFIMSNIPGSLEKYLILYRERYEYALLDTPEKQKQFRKDKCIQNKTSDYLDYSWVSNFTEDKTYGRNQMIKLARLDEFQEDIEETLNSFAHGSISVFQMNKDNWNLMRDYVRRANLTCCKLYDFLCCSFHNLIGHFEFQKLSLSKHFEVFKNIQNYYYKKEGSSK